MSPRRATALAQAPAPLLLPKAALPSCRLFPPRMTTACIPALIILLHYAAETKAQSSPDRDSNAGHQALYRFRYEERTKKQGVTEFRQSVHGISRTIATIGGGPNVLHIPSLSLIRGFASAQKTSEAGRYPKPSRLRVAASSPLRFSVPVHQRNLTRCPDAVRPRISCLSPKNATLHTEKENDKPGTVCKHHPLCTAHT